MDDEIADLANLLAMNIEVGGFVGGWLAVFRVVLSTRFPLTYLLFTALPPFCVHSPPPPPQTPGHLCVRPLPAAPWTLRRPFGLHMTWR